MTNPCPLCDSVDDNHCLQCVKCNDWIHYGCSKFPPYMIIQLSKSTRAFTCNSCVKTKFPLVFDKLYAEINETIGKQDGQAMPPSVCGLSPLSPLSPSAPLIPVSPLTPSAPLPPPSPFTPPLLPLAPLTIPAPVHSPVTQVPSYPLTPSAQSLLSTVVPANSTKTRSKLAQASTFSKPFTSNNIQLASTQENISNKPPCNFYMQEECTNGRRGTNCSFPHPNMCFRFIRQQQRLYYRCFMRIRTS